MNPDFVTNATKNVQDILNLSIKFDPKISKALVIFDTENELTQILTQAYQKALPQAEFIDFETKTKEQILQTFDNYSAGDLVVLLQSSSFRLDDFRIRIHLFNKELKVIEHLHLYRNEPLTWSSYIDSLAYDPNWYIPMGNWLQQKLENSTELLIRSQDFLTKQISELTANNHLEKPKLNIGDYTGMKNIGGTFPIGEVFTEAQVLQNMNGSFWVYAFANTNFEVQMSEPFRVDVIDGLVSSWSQNAPQDFVDVIEKIKLIERPIVREIGFGLNRAIDKENPLGDITALERIVGVHLSIGEKHSVYKKEGIASYKARFHVDLFVATEVVSVNGETIFANGEYIKTL
jgi:aminopeptidase